MKRSNRMDTLYYMRYNTYYRMKSLFTTEASLLLQLLQYDVARENAGIYSTYVLQRIALHRLPAL